jgi:putative transposase
MRIQSLNHCAYQLQYHIVWGTKYRRKWLKSYVKEELIKSVHQTVKKYPALHLIALNTDMDHVHLQIEIPPTITIADAVRELKTRSSFTLRKKFKFIDKIYLEKDGIWSVGYFVSSIGLDEERVKKYIAWQGKQEKPQPQTATLF